MRLQLPLKLADTGCILNGQWDRVPDGRGGTGKGGLVKLVVLHQGHLQGRRRPLQAVSSRPPADELRQIPRGRAAKTTVDDGGHSEMNPGGE